MMQWRHRAESLTICMRMKRDLQPPWHLIEFHDQLATSDTQASDSPAGMTGCTRVCCLFGILSWQGAKYECCATSYKQAHKAEIH